VNPAGVPEYRGPVYQSGWNLSKIATVAVENI